MSLAFSEILQTLRMLQVENLDIRTTTLGINLLDCAGGSVQAVADRIHDKVARHAEQLVKVAREVEGEFGISIVNKRSRASIESAISEPSSGKSMRRIMRSACARR
jgi:uncharacterized protein (UPF0210 family)